MLQYVKDFLNKRGDTQVKSKPKTYNSFVSPGAKFEYEIDTTDMEPKNATSNARYGLVAIGNFTKIAKVVPIKNGTPEAMTDGSKKIFISMGEPKQLYSDEESSMMSSKWVDFLTRMKSSRFKPPLMLIQLRGLSEHLDTIYIGDCVH